jgi:hypothetical protein
VTFHAISCVIAAHATSTATETYVNWAILPYNRAPLCNQLYSSQAISATGCSSLAATGGCTYQLCRHGCTTRLEHWSTPVHWVGPVLSLTLLVPTTRLVTTRPGYSARTVRNVARLQYRVTSSWRYVETLTVPGECHRPRYSSAFRHDSEDLSILLASLGVGDGTCVPLLPSRTYKYSMPIPRQYFKLQASGTVKQPHCFKLCHLENFSQRQRTHTVY